MKKLFPLFIFALFAIVACDDDDKKVPLDNSVVQFIESKYPGAQIRHSEYSDNGLIEVDILHNSIMKEVYFSKANKWEYTSWDVRLSEVPSVVINAVNAAYPDFRIDDVDYIERENALYYEFELEKGGADIYVNVTPEGEILNNN